MKNSNFLFAATLTIATSIFSSSIYADVYRWVDKKTGEIYFSETPPPPEVASEYENVSPKLEARTLKRQETQGETEQPRASNTAPQKTETETKPAPKPASKQVISDEALLALRRCQNFQDQISRLEVRISQTENPDEMDSLILKLAEYQESFDTNCKSTTN